MAHNKSYILYSQCNLKNVKQFEMVQLGHFVFGSGSSAKDRLCGILPNLRD
jgi:hypothetical protein